MPSGMIQNYRLKSKQLLALTFPERVGSPRERAVLEAKAKANTNATNIQGLLTSKMS